MNCLLNPVRSTCLGITLCEVASSGISKLNHYCNALCNRLSLIASNLISAGVGIFKVEHIALDIPSGKKIFTMYDNESGEMDVISTDNIIEYLDLYGVPEQESNRINNLDVGEVWQNKWRTLWIRIK
jgi:hypothetical protein